MPGQDDQYYGDDEPQDILNDIAERCDELTRDSLETGPNSITASRHSGKIESDTSGLTVESMMSVYNGEDTGSTPTYEGKDHPSKFGLAENTYELTTLLEETNPEYNTETQENYFEFGEENGAVKSTIGYTLGAKPQ